jgi:hypothetical protein
MTGSGTSIALLTGLSMVLIASTRDAHSACASSAYSDIAAEVPPPQDIGLAIVKILMVRKIGALADSVLVPLQESFGFAGSAFPAARRASDMAVNR